MNEREEFLTADDFKTENITDSELKVFNNHPLSNIDSIDSLPTATISKTKIGIVGRGKKPLLGQVKFEEFGLDLPPTIELPKSIESFNRNEVEEGVFLKTPIDKRYLIDSKVAFLTPSLILTLKNNLELLSKRGILKVSEKMKLMTDDEFVKKLVVLPNETRLIEGNEEYFFPGGVVALPVSTSGDWGKEQRLLYLGNFSNNHKRSSESVSRYLLSNSKVNRAWRRMTLGSELPVNDKNVTVARVSKNNINEMVSTSQRFGYEPVFYDSD